MWDEGRDQKLRALWASGARATAIGIELGVSKNAVCGRANRIGLGMRKPGRRVGDAHEMQIRRKLVVPPKPPKVAVAGGFSTPVEKPRPAPVAPPPTAKTLDDLARGDCRYPYGDRAPYVFCAEPTPDGSSYCAAHRQTCYRVVDGPPVAKSGPQAGFFVLPGRRGAGT